MELVIGFGMGWITSTLSSIVILLLLVWKIKGLTVENAELRGWATSMEIVNAVGGGSGEMEVDGEDYNGG